ncbi:BspA family leucine-rich repeat surface protein [uncultured Aquimarina sp.]|uniref:BspA family leucine-rich repeat surface protein n=1 Tax=uncultured Aquimarina sp. TaxID=575652 RepID=UPI00261BF655|nr:BspA family leucine-rich repeat surface protein [uncultured Aquimarina sp.]
MIKKIHQRILLYVCGIFISTILFSFSNRNPSELDLTAFVGEFTSIWDTTQEGTSADNEITIPTNPGFTYNYIVDWGDGSTDTNITGDITHTYATAGTYTVKISGDFPAIYFNDGGDRRKIIEILEWGIIEWQTMEDAFHGCENLNFDAIDAPDLSRVTSLKNMFRDCISFNGIVNNWDVSTIADMSGLFAGARIFNRPLDNWNTISVTDLSETFLGANSFNEPLDNWNTASVTTLSSTFAAAGRFNQNINNWDVSQVATMNSTFQDANDFNQPLNNWNVSNVTTMARMFDDARDFNQPLNNWNVSNVTDMTRMFYGFIGMDFNQPLDNWDVGNVTNMQEMFRECEFFNQSINNWNVSNVTNMSGMFERADSFNQSLDNWNVSAVTDMSNMFDSAIAFAQPIDNWDVSNVTNMSEMFRSSSYNQPINAWNVSSVTDMSGMFSGVRSDLLHPFNQPLDNWNVSNVTNMSGMFRFCEFNQPINNWTVSLVSNMSNMFQGAPAFNQPLDTWDVGLVSNFRETFSSASSFNQNLSVWNIMTATNMTNMLSNSGISQENYDNILIGWAAQAVQSNVNLGATNLEYCDGRDARQDLIDTHNWNITGDSVNCTFVLCTQITSPVDGDTNVPANSDIRWDPAPNATGYRVSLRRENGGTTQMIYDNQDFGNVVGLDFTNEFTPGDTVYVTVVPYNDDGPATGCPEISFTVVESWVNSPDAFKLTYDTRIQEANQSTPTNQLRIQTTSGLAYNYSIDWGDGQYDNNVTGEIIHTYLVPGIYTVSIIGTFPSIRHAEFNSDSIKLLSIDQWGTQVWESMQSAFAGCENMEYNATDIPDLSNVTSMSSMFIVCRNFNGNINNWDVSNVTNMSAMFGVTDLYNQPLDNWNVSNVTNMALMFFRTEIFNQNINNWNTSNLLNTSRMFEGAEAFDQPLNNWDVSNVTDMSEMFQDTNAFNQPLDNWDVSNVTTMEEMFDSAAVFNQNIDNWDVSSVTNMNDMFDSATVFNQPLNSWNVANVTSMDRMFYNATAFNQPLDNWDVSGAVIMSSMFSRSSSFNQNINGWNVTNVTTMRAMFSNADVFNEPLDNWDVNSVVDMSSMFQGADVFNQPLNTWNVSAVANMTSMFEDTLLFNQPLDNWDVSSVTIMNSMFEGASVFNQNINSWNVGVVTNMQSMFQDAITFNEPLNSWNTGELQNTQEMFSGAVAFNQNIDAWNVSFVTTMEEMFRDAISYNQGMDSWNVASVTTMEGMFRNATAFNENISSWNVRGVNTMESMFDGATSFNQLLNNWRVSGVENMDYMFRNASSYNQEMNMWIIGNVSMRSMFEDATIFDQFLGDWNVSNVSNMQEMLDNTALSRENYDNTLISWSEQSLTPGINLGAETLLYCESIAQRQSMIDNYGWIFTDDILDCPIPVCTQLISPENGDVDVPVNTNLVWESVLYATSYDLTITLQPSGTVITETVTTTSYEFAANALVGSTSVTVLIEPRNDEGVATGCVSESFSLSTDVASVPECTSLVDPVNGSADIVIDTNLSWDAIPDADGYLITVGTTSGGNDIINNQDVGNITTYDLPTDLPEDTEIFVSITPYNEEGNAAGCVEESFTTELIPVVPSCTTISDPLNGATNVPIDTNLSWSSVDGANGYLVSVGTTQGGIEIANSIDVGNTTTYDFPFDLIENRTFYVTIIPYNAVGDAVACTEESFRTGDSTLNDPPSCTTLTDPLNGAIDVLLTTNLTWNSSSNTDGYRLTVGTTSGGSDIVNNLDVGNTTTYDLPADLPETTEIYVTIIPYNGFGDATGCTEESFTTETLATIPGCTNLSSPLNGATDVSIATDLSWNVVADATGYRLIIGTTSGGSDIVNNLDVGNVITYDVPTDLPENTQIFVTIIPYNAVGDATGCTEENFTTETLATIPVCTNLSSPLNGATDVSIATDLNWNTVTDATGYRLIVGTTSGGSDIVNNLDVGNVITYDVPTDLPENTQIFVTIIPYNVVGDATGCTEESFTTETLETIPGCTSLSSPLNGATDVSIATDLSWNAVANATGYRLIVGTTSGGSDIVNNLDVGNVITYDVPTDLPENTQIFVTIIPYNALGDATGCTEESFTTETLAIIPSCTSLSSPLNGTTDVFITTDLSWNAVPDATGYRLVVGTTSNGSDIVNNLDVGNVTTYDVPTDLPENTQIFVTIIPYNAVGDATGCTEENFTTETLATIPGCTSLSSPLNGATDVSIATDLSWNTATDATGYLISVGTTSGGADIINNEDVGNATTYELPEDLPEATEIFVTIIPYNTVGDAIGCAEQSFITETLVVAIEDDTKYGFSPDGDGINEFWEIDGIENYPENVVSIYNRWGDMVFEISGYNNTSRVFRGTANRLTNLGGGELPEGTYFFNIRIANPNSLKKLKGFLVLKR